MTQAHSVALRACGCCGKRARRCRRGGQPTSGGQVRPGSRAGARVTGKKKHESLESGGTGRRAPAQPLRRRPAAPSLSRERYTSESGFNVQVEGRPVTVLLISPTPALLDSRDSAAGPRRLWTPGGRAGPRGTRMSSGTTCYGLFAPRCRFAWPAGGWAMVAAQTVPERHFKLPPADPSLTSAGRPSRVFRADQAILAGKTEILLQLLQWKIYMAGKTEILLRLLQWRKTEILLRLLQWRIHVYCNSIAASGCCIAPASGCCIAS